LKYFHTHIHMLAEESWTSSLAKAKLQSSNYFKLYYHHILDRPHYFQCATSIFADMRSADASTAEAYLSANHSRGKCAKLPHSNCVD